MILSSIIQQQILHPFDIKTKIHSVEVDNFVFMSLCLEGFGSGSIIFRHKDIKTKRQSVEVDFMSLCLMFGVME